MPHVSMTTIWVAIGFIGQGLFFMRFFVQWLASEKQGRSVIPTAFWYFSLSGGLTLFCYALWRRDPVFILGQGTGLFIYLRNIYFIRKEHKEKQNELAQKELSENSTYNI